MLNVSKLENRIASLERIVQGLLGIQGVPPINVQWSGGNIPVIVSDRDMSIPVKVTGFSTHTGTGTSSIEEPGIYTWVEQETTANGEYVDKYNGLSGGPSYAPLVEMNGRIATTFPFYAFARLRADIGVFGPVYEFDLSNQVSASGYNASVVQILGHDASGNLTWYTVSEC